MHSDATHDHDHGATSTKPGYEGALPGPEAGAPSGGLRKRTGARRLKLRIAPKLIGICLFFGLAPALVLFGILWNEGAIIKNAFMTGASLTASTMAETIDRNLFERYGDVQAFGLNEAAQDRANWSDSSASNPLIRAMNGYMTGYGVYKLMLLVDTNGRVVAANTIRPDGSPLATAELLGRDFSQVDWFRKPMNGEFLDGADGFTGTAVSQPFFSEIVARLYSEDGYVLTFSAPVKDAFGTVIGVWVNFVDFGLVEEIVAQTYEKLKQDGEGRAELTILDPAGRVIVDYDPAGQGWTEYRRNRDVIGKMNLAERGVAAAEASVRGEDGAMVALHGRKQVEQAAGYARSKGAYGYPGLGWSALVRIPVEEAFAAWNSLILVMLIALAVAAGVTAVAGFAIGKAFSRPIRSLTETMMRLAEGDKAIDVRHTDRVDEIGDMARTLEVFKRNAVEMDRMQEAERKAEEERVEAERRAQGEKEELERTAQEDRRRAMRELADRFDASVAGVIETVTAASTELQSTAESMSATAEETSRQSTAVASASEEASTNVQTVASAAEEMSSSVDEIGRQVTQSAEIARKAVAEAGRTNETVQGLAEAAQKIGEVVNLISDIAEQTNLLALNATIEAARAGDAGKGFAVVASEVKSLATQTAKATEEIASQIGGVQSVTGTAVEAIKSIGTTIGQINEIATAIASAVEEQGAATQEIARNATEAAKGTTEVSSNIANVSQAATETGAAAKQVLDSAGQLSEEAVKLKGEVEKFLTEVRAA